MAETRTVIIGVIVLVLLVVFGGGILSAIFNSIGGGESNVTGGKSSNRCAANPRNSQCGAGGEGGANSNNNNYLQDGSGKLVMFYTDWCGYCKQLKPVWDQVERDYPELVTRVNADNRPELARAFSIKGYPTILWASNGLDDNSSVESYEGGYDYESIVNFLNNRF